MNNEITEAKNNEIIIPEDAIKLSDEEKLSVEPLLKGFGEILLNEAQNANLTNQFNKAISGSYTCTIDPGQHLAKFTDGSGATIGMVFDEKNNLKHNARWFENNATLNTATTVNIVSNAFSVLSAITGQYYLASINNEIKNLRKEISSVESMIEAEHESELEWIYKCLKEDHNHIEYIKKDPSRLTTFLNALDGYINTAGKEVLYYKRIVTSKIKYYSDDSLETVNNNAKKLEKYLLLMQTAVQLLCCLKMLKIYATTKIEDEELRLYKEEIEVTLNDFLNFAESRANGFLKYLDSVKSLNKFTAKEKFIVACGGAATLTSYLFVTPLGNLGLKETFNYINSTQRTKSREKRELTDKAKELSDNSWIRGIETSLDNYVDNQSRSIELIVDGNDIYWLKGDNTDEK